MTKINIVLSCSQQAWNQCLLCESEESHTYEIALKCATLLKNYNANVFVIPKSIAGTEAETLNQVVDASNNFITANGGKGYHLDIHTDGGYNGNGSSGFYMSDSGNGFISIIHNEVSKVTPSLDGGISNRNLYVLRATKAIAGLIELTFHDKIAQIKHLHDNYSLYAEAIVKGLIKACGLIKISDDTNIITKEDLEFYNVLQVLVNENKIQSPEYWMDNAKINGVCKGEYVRQLILNIEKTYKK